MSKDLCDCQLSLMDEILKTECDCKGERVKSELTIKSTIKEITGWTKEIRLERDGETYLASLYWSNADGYDLVFRTNPIPKWVGEWQDSQQYGAESLEYTLDCLTEREDGE